MMKKMFFFLSLCILNLAAVSCLPPFVFETEPEQCQSTLVNYSDLSPTVQENSTVTMTVEFNSTLKPHPVYWYSTALREKYDVTNSLITLTNYNKTYALYKTSHVIEHLTDDNQGRYTLYVCGKALQKFLVSFDTPSCQQSPPIPIGTSRLPYIGPVGINHTMTCTFKGDTSPFGPDTKWNCSDVIITSSSSKYLFKQFDVKSCSFKTSLTLIRVSASDTGHCTCYAVSVDGKVGKSLSFSNTFLDYPSILQEPNTSTTYTLHDPLQLQWKVSGTVQWNQQYILPQLSVNGVFLNDSLCDCQLYFRKDTVLSSDSYLVFKVSRIKDITDSSSQLRLQVYLKFQPSVSDVSDYNTRITNHSRVIVINIDEAEPPSRPWFHSHYFVYSSPGGGVLIIITIVIFIICVSIYFKKRGRRNCNEAERQRLLVNLPGDEPRENIEIVQSDDNEDESDEEEHQSGEDREEERENDSDEDHSSQLSSVSSHTDHLLPLIQPVQEVTRPPTDSMPEVDNHAADSQQAIITNNIRQGSGATPTMSHTYTLPFQSQSATPFNMVAPSSNSSFVVSDRGHLVAPSTSRLPKRRVTETEEEEIGGQ